MKIIKCHIENFGQLSNIDMSFDDGLNVIKKENGWGKSTFAAFIKVMFFGFDFDRSRDILKNERKHYMPWQGGIYGGSIIFEAAGRKYNLTRTFGAAQRDDRFELRDAISGKVSDDYSENIGEELFETDRESFEQTFYISQSSCGAYITDKMSANMAETASAFDGKNDAEGAAEKLAKAASTMTPDRKTGSLYKCGKRISELKNIISKKPALEAEAAEFQGKLSELRDSLDRSRKEIGDIRAVQAKAGEYLEYANSSGRYGMLKENCEQRLAKMKTLRGMFPGKLPDKNDVLDDIRKLEDVKAAEKEIEINGLSEEEELELYDLDIYLSNKDDEESETEYDDSPLLIWGGMSILFFLIFIILVFCKIAAGAILSGAVLVFCAATFLKKYKMQQKSSADVPEEMKMYIARYEDLKERREYSKKLRVDCENAIREVHTHLKGWNIRSDGDFSEQLRGLSEALEDYRNSVKEYKDAESKLKSFEESPEGRLLELEDEESIREKMKNIKGNASELLEKQKEIEKIEKLYRETAAGYDAVRKKTDEIRDAEAELESLNEEYEKQLKKYNIILRTQKILEEARTNFNMRYSEPLQNAFFRYLSCFSNGTGSIKAEARNEIDSAKAEAGEETGITGLRDKADVCDGVGGVGVGVHEEAGGTGMHDHAGVRGEVDGTKIHNADNLHDFAIDSDGNITYIQSGLRRDLDFHSSGYRDIAAICLRMAVIDTIYSAEKPCVIFDDPFVSLDSKNKAAAENMIKNAAKEHQIIYFTRI